MTDQPEMSPLTEPEREWVRVRRDFAAQEGVDHLDLDAVAAYYDAVLARSQAEAEELDPEELAVLLDVVAVLLGEHLGARHGMQWVTVADEEGPALALRDTLSDAVVFPQPVVGQSWNHQATGSGWASTSTGSASSSSRSGPTPARGPAPEARRAPGRPAVKAATPPSSVLPGSRAGR